MIVAGLFTSSSSATAVILIAAWVAVWGVLSLVVISAFRRPRLLWLLLGLAFPFGPLVALIVGLVSSRFSDSEAWDVE